MHWGWATGDSLALGGIGRGWHRTDGPITPGSAHFRVLLVPVLTTLGETPAHSILGYSQGQAPGGD